MPINSERSTESSRRRKRPNDLMEQMKFIPDGYDDFMSDLNLRLRLARQQWGARLEDFTMRMTNQSSSGPRTSNTSVRNNTPFFTPPSPFKVLLQMFAYKEVLENHKLDQAFVVDGGEQMTFYVPQLLSFLLHGAFDNSPQLEEWILAKCKSNVHFAHRCYWFLRAWCLEQEHSAISVSRDGSDSSLQQQQHQHRRNHSNASSTGSSVWSGEDGLFMLSGGGSSGLLGLETPPAPRRPSKYYPEERTLIEGLMYRVMECGEIPARKLQYGSGEESELEMSISVDDDSPAALANAGLVPSDPENGVASSSHVETVNAERQYGFIPLKDGLGRQPLPPGGCFMDTPRFLDALTSVADGLFLVPRDKRLYALRQQLKSMEVDFLPSNAIYLPVHNVYHRVWRIVADESIAISTKERVPCIIYFEVIDYSHKKDSSLNTDEEASNSPRLKCEGAFVEDGSSAHVVQDLNADAPGKKPLKPLFGQPKLSDQETIALWKDSWRDPQRHNSLLDKVTNFTQMTVKKFRDQHSNDAFFWINRDNSGSWHDSIQMPFDTDNQEEDVEAGLGRKFEASSEQVPQARTRPPRPPHTSRLQSDAHTDGDAQTNPVTDVLMESAAEMGQWSSPTGAVINKPRRKRTLSELRADRSSHSGVDGEEVMDALIGIRSSMDRFNEHDSGSFGASPVIGSSSPKTPSTCGETLSARSSSSRKKRPPPVVFKESFASKQERVRATSAYGHHPGWKLLPILIKSNDDLRQEQLASQLIYQMACILARERCPVWLCPYEIVALTDTGGVIEAIPDTISIDSLKRNSKDYTSLGDFFLEHFGNVGTDDYADAKACFVESLAAYSIVCYLLQIKDRHNGNILLDTHGHLIHIDFGFFFLSSPGKNSGFESAPFKLTREFVNLMNGPDSKTFRTFRELCCRTFLSLRRNCHQITLLVEMLMNGNEDLPCFRGRPEDAVRELRERFRLDLNDRACTEYVNALVDESLENWRTRWYDRYQRYCVGVL